MVSGAVLMAKRDWTRMVEWLDCEPPEEAAHLTWWEVRTRRGHSYAWGLYLKMFLDPDFKDDHDLRTCVYLLDLMT